MLTKRDIAPSEVTAIVSTNETLPVAIATQVDELCAEIEPLVEEGREAHKTVMIKYLQIGAKVLEFSTDSIRFPYRRAIVKTIALRFELNHSDLHKAIRYCDENPDILELCTRVHNLHWNHLKYIAALPPEHRKEVIAKIARGELKTRTDVKEFVARARKKLGVERKKRPQEHMLLKEAWNACRDVKIHAAGETRITCAERLIEDLEPGARGDSVERVVNALDALRLTLDATLHRYRAYIEKLPSNFDEPVEGE